MLGILIISVLLCGKNLTEIQDDFSEVCGVFTVDRSTVPRWANRFCGDCVSTDNYLRPGRKRTSTDERSVKLVTDALEEDRRATLKNFLEPREQNLRRKMHRSQLLVANPLILHYNAPTHITDVVTKKLRVYWWEVVPHAPHSPVISPQTSTYSQR